MYHNTQSIVIIALIISAGVLWWFHRYTVNKEISNHLLQTWCWNAVNSDPVKRPSYLPKTAIKSAKKFLTQMGYETALQYQGAELTTFLISTKEGLIEIPIKDIRSEKM